MAKQKPVIKIRSYGIYALWQSKSKDLPKIQEFTQEIPAEIDIEFGLTINIKNARGSKIFYTIKHPGIIDDAGKVRDAFTGEVHVTNNDWEFYLGDTIWAPIKDKCGDWEMSIELKDKLIAHKVFTVSAPHSKDTLKKRALFFYLMPYSGYSNVYNVLLSLIM